jgi:hypothetical protein
MEVIHCIIGVALTITPLLGQEVAQGGQMELRYEKWCAGIRCG